MLRSQRLRWYAPNDLVSLGFQRSRLVLLNEAHHGLLRSVRTRRIGQSILAAAHAAGCRHLAIEALDDQSTALANTRRQAPCPPHGYLAQPDLQRVIQTALDLGWTLHAYEADSLARLCGRHGIDLTAEPSPEAVQARIANFQDELLSQEHTNWREAEQARRVTVILEHLPPTDRLLVWCGNGHLYTTQVDDWTPMGWQLARMSGVEPFAIDQIVSVAFPGTQERSWQQAAVQYHDELQARGGTAGLLVDELDGLGYRPGVDAILLSTDNAME